MVEVLLPISEQFSSEFIILLVEGQQETTLFRYLSNRVFGSP